MFRMISIGRLCAVLAVGLILLGTHAGYGGFIEQTIRVDLPELGGPHGPPPWAGPPDFVFSLLPDDASQGLLLSQPAPLLKPSNH